MKKNVDWNYLNRFFKNFPLFILLFTSAYAAVPSRITYQGRLSKSGVGAAGRHTITVQFITASGEKLPASQTFDVDVPVSGDFSLNIDNIPPDADWINGLPQMRVIVGGETLTPDQSFSATPYALVARNVENLDTSKVKLAGSKTGALLSSWQSAGNEDKIDAKVIVGTVPYVVPDNISPSKIQGTALVLISTVTQIIQPHANVVPLTIRSNPSVDKEVNLIEIHDYSNVPTERFHIQGTGTAFFNGNVGIGTPAPSTKLEVSGGDLKVEGSITSSAGRYKDKTGDVMPVGTVLPFAGITLPPGWLLCDGAIYIASNHPELEDLRKSLGSTYGGDGISTFAVPDFRGRVPMGSGQGTGLTSRSVGQSLGEEGHSLSRSETAPHTHGGTTNSGGVNHTHTTNSLSLSNAQTIGTGQNWVSFGSPKLISGFDALGSGDAINQLGYDHNHGTSGASDYLHTHTFLTEGMTTGAETQGQPHNIIQPSLVVNYIIKY
jgi:microcystin-dependent protein